MENQIDPTEPPDSGPVSDTPEVTQPEGKGREWNRVRTSRRFFVGSLALAGAIAFDQEKNEIDRLEVVEKVVSLPRWSAGAVKIAFLTDWHLNDVPATNRVKLSLGIALEYKPDFILFGGDYISSLRPWRIRWITEVLRELRGYRGVVAGVYGNHDGGGRKEILAAFSANRAHLLVNEVLDRDGIEIVGLDDAITGSPDYAVVTGRTERDNRIVLFHEPDFAASLVKSASLTLCGHTHGGQICLPGGIPLRLPDGGRNFVSGEFRMGSSAMYVSRGLGTTGLAMRAFCRPEISILELRSQ